MMGIVEENDVRIWTPVFDLIMFNFTFSFSKISLVWIQTLAFGMVIQTVCKYLYVSFFFYFLSFSIWWINDCFLDVGECSSEANILQCDQIKNLTLCVSDPSSFLTPPSSRTGCEVVEGNCVVKTSCGGLGDTDCESQPESCFLDSVCKGFISVTKCEHITVFYFF
jgi:hypothetical protein